jgi:DNA ligase (NAD+)
MYATTTQQKLNTLTDKLVKGELISTPKEMVEALREVINYHDWRYYVLSEPLITDFNYDTLYKQLKALEEVNPELVTQDSPTQRVSGAITDDFKSVAHLASMLSLDNSYNPDDLIDFDRKVKELTGQNEVEYCVEPKFDGASLALVYENDFLVRGATRGDGTMGEDITHNVRALNSIPLKAAFSKHGIYKIELRGEVIIENNTFKEINEARKEAGLKLFQNSRNTASGSLRLKDPKEAASRGLEGIMYHISYAADEQGKDVLLTNLTSHFENIKLLYESGFKTPSKEIKLCKGIDEVIAYCNEWNTRRHEFNIETDGMVIKVNSLKLQQRCGSTTHHPRWAIAFKFQAKQAQSKLLDVEYQVGRTGAITPVAKIEPVALAGVTISSISLHNEDFITGKDIRIHDTVIVERAGEVIPYIVGVVTDLRTGIEQQIHFPKNCPICNTDLVRPEEEAIWRCDNAECPAQVEERVIHYVSKDAMDIDGLGRSILIDFIERGYLKNIEGIYQLPYEEILKLEGWGTKSVDNLKAGVEDSKNRPLWRLLVGLGIRHVGVTTAKDISSHINSAFDLMEISLEQLTNIEGIGPKVAQSVFDFFNNEGNKHLLHELKRLGVNTENREQDKLAKNNKLEGKTFLFTGTLQSFTRDRAKQMVEENGGKLLSSVSANLNYLVTGGDAGSKLAKAQKIPSITILSEEEFLAMVE